MNTENNSIDNLLQLYFEGETNERQEQELKDYFESGQVAAEHVKYAAFFSFFKEDKSRYLHKVFNLKNHQITGIG